MSDAKTSTHSFKFTRAGGFVQPRLEDHKDFAHLAWLDQKLWAALACPAKGIEFDERTLALIDTDMDGRIRAPELIAAVDWARSCLKDLGHLKDGRDVLALSSVADSTDDGKAVLAAAKRILAGRGKADAAEISLAEVLDTAALFAATSLNGDGVVPADTVADEAVTRVAAEIVDCLGGVADRSGKQGVDAVQVDAFFTQADAFRAWATAPSGDPAILPLGDGTAAAAAAVAAVRAKVDDYFSRCRLAAFDERSLGSLNRSEGDYAVVAASDLSADARELAAFPLSRVEAGRPLPLTTGVNPAWSAAVARLLDVAVRPILGKDAAELTPEGWATICARVAPFEAWQAAKPATAVEKLGTDRLGEILASDVRAALDAAVAADAALAPEFDAIEKVERLVRYQRDLYRFSRNFVNLLDFYTKSKPASFQAGTLYLDGRACDLCVRVDNAGRHAALAGLSKAYLAYCDCTRPSGEKMSIAAAFTDGDSDYLMVGRNGIFYDRQGRDWDAVITKVVENPISIREAFWSPYKKFVRLIETAAAKRAAAAEAESDKSIAAAADKTAQADKTLAAESKPKKIDVGTVAALGVAVGALGTMLTAIIGYLTGLVQQPFWIVCLAVAGILLLISTPSMVIAWLKLRQRNLAPILDANGWAVNGRVKLSVRFGKSLTHVAGLPAGSSSGAGDPNADRPSWIFRGLVLVVVAGFVVSLLRHFEVIDIPWLPKETKAAPAATPPAGTDTTPPAGTDTTEPADAAPPAVPETK